jgi:hypothetical protein
MGGVVSAVGNLITGGGGGSSSAPATPDYTGAANATAANNLKAAQSAVAANRVNQYTPYGALNYQQTGVDSQGNPMWGATQSVAPGLQSAVNKSQNAVSSYNLQPFETSNLPSYGINPGEAYSDAIMRRLQPLQAQQREASDVQLANQGIMPGSEAYNRAKTLLSQGQNDQLTSAIVGGMDTGLKANQLQFGQDIAKYQTNLQSPLAYASAVKSLATPNYINPSQQASTTGADTLGAVQAGYNANMGAYNAQQAQNASLTGGLMGLGGTLGAAYMLSDIRTKEHIKTVGWLPNGLPVYEYEYKPEFKDIGGHGKFIGVMAQEVEMVQPEAVITRADGYKMVNYGALNG